jgi:hypothetical protein
MYGSEAYAETPYSSSNFIVYANGKVVYFKKYIEIEKRETFQAGITVVFKLSKKN